MGRLNFHVIWCHKNEKHKGLKDNTQARKVEGEIFEALIKK